MKFGFDQAVSDLCKLFTDDGTHGFTILKRKKFRTVFRPLFLQHCRYEDIVIIIIMMLPHNE